jgi:hypothetical protein
MNGAEVREGERDREIERSQYFHMFTKNMYGVIGQRIVFFAKYIFPNQCCTCEKEISLSLFFLFLGW